MQLNKEMYINKIMKYIKLVTLAMALSFFGSANAQNKNEKYLDGLTPEAALAYMKENPDIYIIDVREEQWYKGAMQFAGNRHIPSSELARRLKEIPADRPIIINCGMGWVAPKAYKKIKESGIAVKQIGYIDGTPLFRQYNDWKKKQK